MGASLVYLDRPNTAKKTFFGKSNGLKFAGSSMQGWRLSNEDTHICHTQIDENGVALFAVFDGHGGIEVAKFCERHFISVLLQNQCYKAGDYVKALKAAFLTMD